MSGSVYKLIAIVGGFGMSCIAAIAYEVFKKYSLYGDAVKEEDGESDEEDEQKEDGEETEV